jgi:thioredoxin-like negative regulator of GroEL
MVVGFVSGALLAFNGFFWSQCVIVEVYPLSVLSLMGVLCCLMRWLYAPQQRHYLYLASLLFGICFTNHQTLIVAAMGIEVAVLAVQPKLGRDLFCFNSIVYLLGLLAKRMGALTTFDANLPLFVIYNVIGIGSLYTWFWFALRTDWLTKAKLVLMHLSGNLLIWVIWLLSRSRITAPEKVLQTDNNYAALLIAFNAVGLGGLFLYYWLSGKTERWITEWVLWPVTKQVWARLKPLIIIMAAWSAGAAFYFYMPLTSMTNPPMNWGYPRTYDGFLHALTRGQYERTNPTSDLDRFLDQIRMYCEGAAEEFNLVYLAIGIVPFVFFRRLQKREQSWLIGLLAICLFLSVLLMILLNPTTDKQSRDLTKVFFTASYVMIAMWIGYGLTLIGGFLLTQYEQARAWVLYGSAGAAAIALYSLARTFYEVSFPLVLYTAIFGVGLSALLIAVLLLARTRAPVPALLAAFALLPIYPIMSHWAENEQRGHMFGFWFGHDMFRPPFGIYPDMTRDAILFGGTDPGRFCPTYMIFCESLIPPHKRYDPEFDRRDVYIITQNALADTTYLNYIRAHYNRSAQIDPPFFQEMFRTRKAIEEGVTNALARAVAPLDRFFTNLGKRIEDHRRARGVYPPKEIHTPTPEESKKCFEDYITEAQKRLAAGQLEPGEDVRIVDNRVQVAGQVSVMQINGLLTKVIFDANPTNDFFVEESFPLKWMYTYLSPYGIIMKINREPLPEITETMVKNDHDFWCKFADRLSGNWIDYSTSVKEICDFVERVYRRGDLRNFKGDPKFVRDNDAQKAFSKLRSAIAGVYSWRVNNAKTPAEQQRMIKEADFAFKQAFSFCPFSPEAVFRYANLLVSLQRLDDALLIAEVCRKFDPENKGVADLVAQLTAFKQGASPVIPPQNQLGQLEQQFRSNPGNVQVALSLVAAYLQNQQTNQAMTVLDLVIAQLEPQFHANPSNASLAFSLVSAYAQRQKTSQAHAVLDQLIRYLEPEYRAHPTNTTIAFHLAQAYIQRQLNNQALAVLDQVIALPQADVSALLTAAQGYAQLGSVPKLETALLKLVTLIPENPEAWYDLAALQAVQGKNDQALKSLAQSLQLNKKRMGQQPGAKNLSGFAAQDPRFQALRSLPEFKKLMSAQ